MIVNSFLLQGTLGPLARDAIRADSLPASKLKPTPPNALSAVGANLLNREDARSLAGAGDAVSKGNNAGVIPSSVANSLSSVKKAGATGGVNQIRRPNPAPVPGPAAKKPKQSCIKDVPLWEASKYGSLNEFAYFDRVSGGDGVACMRGALRCNCLGSKCKMLVSQCYSNTIF